jgi:AraC-like DNA-binding protein
LRETREKLHTIARLSGFSGAEHFTRTFRRVTGAPPSVFRRQSRSAGTGP